jgi:hypothetical protein
MACKKCGANEMMRRKREGFLEKSIYPRFGYYPWVCAICKKEVLLKVRGDRRKKKRTAESEEEFKRSGGRRRV